MELPGVYPIDSNRRPGALCFGASTPGYLFGKLVISGLPKPSGGCEIACVEFRPYDESLARVCTGERCTWLYEPGLDHLLSAVDEAERLSRKPPGAEFVGERRTRPR